MSELESKEMTIQIIIKPVSQLLNIATDLQGWNSRL